jgi:hypothetical protein
MEAILLAAALAAAKPEVRALPLWRTQRECRARGDVQVLSCVKRDPNGRCVIVLPHRRIVGGRAYEALLRAARGRCAP